MTYPRGTCECGCGSPLSGLTKDGTPQRFISGHNWRGKRFRPLGSPCSIDGCTRPIRCSSLCSRHYDMKIRTGTPTPYRPTEQERFWERVHKEGGPDGCWEWSSPDRKGYGSFQMGGKSIPAHRLSYEWLVGPIPGGMHIDHLCRNRACVNPDHLEPVTPRENVMRGMHPNVVTSRTLICKRGHDMSGDGSYVHPRWGRACRECRRLHRRGTRDREKARLRKEGQAQ